jgi:hypothetical protein
MAMNKNTFVNRFHRELSTDIFFVHIRLSVGISEAETIIIIHIIGT